MKTISPDLIRRYLQGTCSDAERKTVDDWYSTYENRDDLLSSLSASDREELQAKMFIRIKSRIEEVGRVQPVSEIRSIAPGVRWYNVATRIAASLLIVALVSFIVQLSIRSLKTTPSDVIVNNSKVIKEEVLADGSVVLMYPGARILMKGFDQFNREISFEGKAFFNIRRDTAHAFRIYTGNVVTRVLGTSFTIDTHNQQKQIEVAVVSGMVSVESTVDSRRIVLTPKQRVTYGGDNHELVKEEVPVKTKQEIWSNVNLSFDNEDVNTIVTILNQRFDVEIKTSNPKLLNCRLRADFTDQNLVDILEMLTMSIDAQYTINDNKIEISGEGCTN